MTQSSFDDLLTHIGRIHERTLRVVRTIPPDRLEWTFAPGKFTLGDLVRHIAGINRYMFVETAALRPSRYPGHDSSLAAGLDAVLRYFTSLHEQSIEILRRFSVEDFSRRCSTPDNNSITVWKWLRAMTEHEIHHRGQMFVYPAILGVEAPPLFGLKEEEVRARSTAS
jgi:uncharacterized damage-inducible protein DinB